MGYPQECIEPNQESHAAEYVCAGEMASLNESTYHFGLATPLYTHFTSPIRRYADQVVHRMAAVAVGWDEPSEELADAPRLGELARSLNEAGAQRIAKVTKQAAAGKLVNAVKQLEVQNKLP